VLTVSDEICLLEISENEAIKILFLEKWNNLNLEKTDDDYLFSIVKDGKLNWI